MNISVLGCGRWASFIAWYLAGIKNNVLIWGRESSENFQLLAAERKNRYLELGEDINFTSDLSYAVDSSDIIVISIESQQLRNLLQNLK